MSLAPGGALLVVGDVVTDIVARHRGPLAPGTDTAAAVRRLPGGNRPAAPVTALLPSRTGRSARQRVFLDAAQRFLDPPPWRGKA